MSAGKAGLPTATFSINGSSIPRVRIAVTWAVTRLLPSADNDMDSSPPRSRRNQMQRDFLEA